METRIPRPGRLACAVLAVLAAAHGQSASGEPAEPSEVWMRAHRITPEMFDQVLDGSGRTVYEQGLAGTDPRDPRSVFRARVVEARPEDGEITFHTVRGRRYQVRASEDLVHWSDVGEPVTGIGGDTSVDVPGAGEDNLFFRVKLLPDTSAAEDGLLDWENHLLGLDPARVDSHGIGVPDGWLFRQGLVGDPAAAHREIPGHSHTWFDRYREEDAPSSPVEPWVPVEIGPQPPAQAEAVPGGVSLASAALGEESLFFAYRPVRGDFDFTARVASISMGERWSLGGIAAMDRLLPGSAAAFVAATADQGISFYTRSSREAPLAEARATVDPQFPDTWLALRRRGNEFTALRSFDGVNWIEIQTRALDMPEVVFVGMGNASASPGKYSTAVFREIKLEQAHRLADFWEDPVSGLVEVASASSLDPAAPAAVFGDWQEGGGGLVARDLRGWLEYSLDVPEPGFYRLVIEGGQANRLSDFHRFPLVVEWDGAVVGRPVLEAPAEGGDGAARVHLPKLAADPATVRVEWRNGRRDSRLRLAGLRLERLDGPDESGSGRPDWIDTRLETWTQLPEPPAESIVSPLPLEGLSPYPGHLRLAAFAAGGDSPYADSGLPADDDRSIRVRPGLSGHWFADVPLRADGPARIEVSAQNGLVDRQSLVRWRPVDVAETGDIDLRAGGTLRFTVAGEDGDPYGPEPRDLALTITPPSGDPVEIQADAADTPTYTFARSGPHEVAAAWSEDGAPASAAFEVTAHAADLGPPPAVMPGEVRRWQPPGLPDSATLETDDFVFLREDGSDAEPRAFDLSVARDQPGAVLARLGGPEGPILAATRTLTTRNDRDAHLRFHVRKVFDDGTRLVEASLSLGEVPPDLRVRLRGITSDVLFEDGSRTRWLTADDFDDTGRVRYRMIAADHVFGTAACHNVVFYDGDTVIGRID